MLFGHKRGMVALALAIVGASAHAIVIDGTAEAAYGAALFTQKIGTGFGDATNGSTVVANGGSELDSYYGSQDASNLYGVTTGNLESNYNHGVLFFDTGAPGFNTIGSDNASSADFGYINSLAGLTFDAGFNASYALWFRNGPGDATNTLYVSLAKLGAAGGDIFDISDNAGGTDTTTIRKPSTTGFASALNNSNVAGVDGSNGGASSGAGVTTGFEYSLALSLIGNPTGPIRIAGMITGGNYLSNQVIGGLPVGTGNLANASTVNLSQYAGTHWVYGSRKAFLNPPQKPLPVPPGAVPEPASIAALGLGVVALMRRRRTK